MDPSSNGVCITISTKEAVMNKAVLLSIDLAEIEPARFAIEQVLGCRFSAHQSDYRGGDYHRCDFESVEMVLQENFIEDDGERTEASFPEVKLIVYLDGPRDRVERLHARLLAADAPVATLRSSGYQ